MPFILGSIGLEEVLESEDTVRGLIGHAVENGRVFYGYYGNAYIHAEYGDVEMYACIVNDEDEQTNILEKADIQVSGHCMWTVNLSDLPLDDETAFGMTRLVGVKNPVSGGFTIMHLLNADILPSFLDDDEIKAQVIAFGLDVNYFRDEEALSDTVPEVTGSNIEELNGKKLLPAIGSVLPNGFLKGHMVSDDGTTEENSENDDIVLVTGLVKGVFVDRMRINDEDISRFIRILLDTQFGELELVHSREMISDEEFELLKTVDPENPEIIVSAAAVLSGDVAINEYENGVVRDIKNNLAALRYALVQGNAERLKTILDEEVVYESDNSEKVITGLYEVIDHINYVHDNTGLKFSVRLGNLDDGVHYERCIVIEYEKDKSVSIVRIDVSAEGLITFIEIFDAIPGTYTVDEEPRYTGPFGDED